ncbi:hypothetical protein N800_10975 [Lysobacter daejeonensis GH1-9]|uniref:DUF2846 domain-containing protein n=1 Tax=Lysobacter daejeonensis GH1-9 TaxID=1385517 RepID=A0A0A0F003_9GAMM|nr:hypothetical protein [Lysobacter daejeonensis]KGM56124.1 hypothetical protein N800_10975 [Lysobacter daejeonensis GH1-9]
MKLLRAVLATAMLFAVLVPAHAGKMAKSKEPLAVAPDKATIVFMRPGKFVGAAVAVPVFDVTGDETKFVGLADAGSKVAYTVPAGEHVFMTTVFGGTAGVRFYKAQVEAGKVYYFRARIIQGIWGLEPVRQAELATADFSGEDKGTALTVNSPKTLAWAEENHEDVAKKHHDLEPQSISDENTLRVEDGR